MADRTDSPGWDAIDAAKLANEVAYRTKQEGSSCCWLALILDCDAVSDPLWVRLQTIAVEGLERRLLGRQPYGRELTLYGKNATVVFRPGKKSCLKVVEDAVKITLRQDHLMELAQSLEPHAGLYPVPGLKNLVLQVLKTEIKDRDGKVVDIVEIEFRGLFSQTNGLDPGGHQGGSLGPVTAAPGLPCHYYPRGPLEYSRKRK